MSGFVFQGNAPGGLDQFAGVPGQAGVMDDG
jgi:hypothetical protein